MPGLEKGFEIFKIFEEMGRTIERGGGIEDQKDLTMLLKSG